MRASFTAMLAAPDDLTEPLPVTIRDNPEPARQARARVQDFRMVLNAEVVSLPGLSVGFADTDGDGGQGVLTSKFGGVSAAFRCNQRHQRT